MGWVATGVVCDQVRVSFPEPSFADRETIGYGEFQDSVTFYVTGNKAMTTVGIAEHIVAWINNHNHFVWIVITHPHPNSMAVHLNWCWNKDVDE